MRLTDVGLTLKDVNLGGIDAESDHKLHEYFVTTPYVESALTGRRTLFLGRKGSGKSALFGQLPRLLTDHGAADATVIPITPDQYAWGILKQYKEQGILSEQAHSNAWKLTLVIELAAHIVSLQRNWKGPARDCVTALTDFLAQNYGSTQPGLLKTATSILKGLKQFRLSCPISG